jgi:hypothetical protein
MKRFVHVYQAMAVLTTLVALTTTANAQDGCGVATLNGNYGFNYEGNASRGKNGADRPWAAVGLLTFDGAGNLSGTFTISVDGTITTGNPYSATYTVNSDCTGVIAGTPGTGADSFTFVIVSGGAEVYAIDLTPGFTSSFDAKKL